MIKALFDLRKLTDADFLLRTNEIADAMTANSNFPNPPITGEDLKKACNQFLTAKENVKLGVITGTTKKEIRTTVENEFYKDFLYVNIQGFNKPEKLKSSLFTIANTKEGKKAVLSIPKNLVVTNSMVAGMIAIKWKADKAARSYLVLIKEDIAGAKWIKYTASKSSFTINDLGYAKTFIIKVAMVGANNEIGHFSSPVSVLVS